MVDARWRFWAAWQNAATVGIARHNALADRSILNVLQALRFERSNSAGHLLTSPEQAAKGREGIDRMRGELAANSAQLRERAALFQDDALMLGAGRATAPAVAG